MTSSNDFLQAFARSSQSASDPGFAVILAFDYYDGPEHGLALYQSGHGVRFSSRTIAPSPPGTRRGMQRTTAYSN